MREILQKCCAAGIAAVILTACSTENVDEQMITLNASGTSLNAETTEIAVEDLVGTWNMYSMTSSDSVDFDQNGIYTYDLLEETDCFDPMYFIFHADGSLDTRQARLFFSETSGAFTCMDSGDYVATYELSGDQLTVKFEVDGSSYTETKTISLVTEGNNQFLDVILTKEETDAAVYISPDPGNTVASDIQKIDMRYIKQ